MRYRTALIPVLLCIFQSLFASSGVACFRDRYGDKPIKARVIHHTATPDGILYFQRGGKYYERIYNYLTPEMFGAKGDGKMDDYAAIQKMLDAGPEGCEFRFDGRKTYYNAFANDGKWRDPLKRNMWQRHRGAIFKFNGAKLRRRMPEWNDKNEKGNYNEGRYYTDEQSALLYITGNNYIIDGADFSSNVPLGDIRDDKGIPTGTKGYAVGEGMTLGLWIDGCSQVTVINSQFTNTVFPVYVTNSKNLTFNKIILKYAAQAYKRISPNDPATGAGIKFIQCENITATGISGYRNANATVEVESLNRNVTVQGSSDSDYDTSMTIIDSENVKVDWAATNVKHGSGVIIVGSNGNVTTRNISGKIKVVNTVWCGVLIWLQNNATQDMAGINLNISTEGNGHAGLFINNESSGGRLIRDLNIRQNSSRDGWGDGSGTQINNAATGIITTNISGAPTALNVMGRNAATPLQVKLNTDSTVKQKVRKTDGSKIQLL